MSQLRIDDVAPTIEIRRAHERFATRFSWLESRHCFSFGRHFDPTNTHHGLLVVSNDDVVLTASGFDTHPHQDMEIVTWVLDGTLEHRDSEGNHDVIYPGLAQRMSAGTGIWHSEMNPSHDASVHFVQMWVVPDTTGVKPSYEQLDISASLASGALVPVASGSIDTAIRIHQRDATLWAGRLAPGSRVEMPAHENAHVYLCSGSLALEGGMELQAQDAARLSHASGLALTATQPCEVLIWVTA